MGSYLASKAARVVIIALSASVWLPMARAQTAAPAAKTDSIVAAPDSATAMRGMDMKAMMKENSYKMSAMAMTGNPDVDFAMMMKIHHQGAIDMAQAELRDGKDPQMRKMATAIISAQKKEMALFDKFLTQKGHAMSDMPSK